MRRDEYAWNYALKDSYWWFVGVRAMVYELLSASVGSRNLGRVLDVGCGTGALMVELTDRADEVWGVDFSQQALAFCGRRDLRRLIRADATRLPLPDGSFDTVTAVGLIEHLDDDERFLRELHRVCRPGGTLILLTSAYPFLWSMHDTANEHQRRYYLSTLERRIGGCGFSTVRFSYLNCILFPAIAAALLAHRAVYGLSSGGSAHRILPSSLPLISAVLTAILRAEARMIRRFRLPWGISMIGAFRRN